MQLLAVIALVVGVVMIAGVTVTLILTRRTTKARPGGMNRWQQHGSIPLVAAGLVIGVVSRGAQSHATQEITFAVASTLFLAAFLCALIGAATATRHQVAARR
jgi:hypothetical protein